MPNYIYKCDSCSFQDNFLMSISQYKSKTNGIACTSCEGGNMTRVFGSNSGVIEKSSEETLSDIRSEAKKIAKKIINGDESLISNIYGGLV